MSWQDNSTYMLVQNWLNTEEWYVDAPNSTAALSASWPHENVFSYLPSRPCVFVAGTDVKIRFASYGGATRYVTCIAVINAHTGSFQSITGYGSLERPWDLKLTHGVGETVIFDWTSISATPIDNWGPNLFYKFDAVLANTYTLHIRGQGGVTASRPEIGCVLLGNYYQFPGNPLVSYERQVRTNVTQLGREFGSAQIFTSSLSKRILSINSNHADEDSRVALERLIAGRGRPRETNTGPEQLSQRRADIPIAFVSPEMWFSSSSAYGGCVFGMIGGFSSSSIVGGRAISQLVLEELV